MNTAIDTQSRKDMCSSVNTGIGTEEMCSRVNTAIDTQIRQEICRSVNTDPGRDE